MFQFSNRRRPTDDDPTIEDLYGKHIYGVGNVDGEVDGLGMTIV